jgi:FkbM family methyltransferase
MAAATMSLLFLSALLGAQALTEMWVRDPKPESFKDMAEQESAQHVADSGMFVRETKNLDAAHTFREKMVLMDFPEEERYVVPKDYVQNGRDASQFAKELCRLWKKHGSVGNMLEVGAGIGTQTMFLAECLEKSKYQVVAVEPQPDLADHLKAGIVANDLRNVQVYAYEMFRSTPNNTLQMNKVRGKDHHSVTMSAHLTTGDAAMRSNLQAFTDVMIAKVTLQGKEGNFFEGAQDFLHYHAPCIMAITLNPDLLSEHGTKVKEVLNLLKKVGYKKTRGQYSIPSLKEVHERKDKLWIIQQGENDDEHMKCVQRTGTSAEKLEFKNGLEEERHERARLLGVPDQAQYWFPGAPM